MGPRKATRFCDTLWPDFDEQTFHDAIVAYQSRERRFGMTSDQLREVASAGKGS